MPPDPCRRTVLARSPEARVEACSCGVIHVSAGAVTLRLSPDVSEALATTLARAMLELARRRDAAVCRTEPRLRVVEGDA